MIRHIFCYIIFIIEFVLLYLFTKYLYHYIGLNNNYYLDKIGNVFLFLIINVIPLVFAILLFGKPNNIHKNRIRTVNYRDITNNMNYTFYAKKEGRKKYSLEYKCNTYYFDFKYWFFTKKRLIDYILI